MENNLDHEHQFRRDQAVQRDDSQAVPGWRAQKLEIHRDLSDIRVLEEGLAASYWEYPNDGSSAQRREEEVRLESERILWLAKEKGLYVDWTETAGYGSRITKKTKESIVFVDEENKRVVKLKDPFAVRNLKSHSPREALYEHIIHNLYFPETRYTFLGVTSWGGELRFILSQPFIRSVRSLSEDDALSELGERGLNPVTQFFIEDEFVRITDYWGSNALIDEKGESRYIDPVINHKVPARFILNLFLSEKLSESMKENEKELLLFYLGRDNDLTVEEALKIRYSEAHALIPGITLLAFQMRHPDKLIFRGREELEKVASEVFCRKVSSDEALFGGYRLYDEFRRKTGKTVAAALMQGTGHNEAIEFEMKDRLDSILRNVDKMDVLDLERAVMEVKGLELKKELGYGISEREQIQILELKEHLQRARKELRQWAKRGFRENNTVLDRILGREFHPQYKLPAKDLILTREGRNYIKLLEKTAEEKYSQDESSLIQLEISKNLLLIAKDAQYRQNTLLQDENADKALGSLIEDTRQKGRTRDMNSRVPLELAWMKLSELKLDNIQEGEVRTVPGMSVSLIKCAQQLTEELVSDDNPQSINPPGKNKALEARRERLERSHEKSLEKTLKKWVSGYGKSGVTMKQGKRK